MNAGGRILWFIIGAATASLIWLAVLESANMALLREIIGGR